MATKTPLNQISELYSDFHKDLTLNPVSNDLARKRNEEAVKESIKNLILTNRGERKFQPYLGSDIQGLLFENITPDIILIIEEKVKSLISQYEPRANVIEVVATAAADDNYVDITIVFNVINSETPVTFTTTLSRIR